MRTIVLDILKAITINWFLPQWKCYSVLKQNNKHLIMWFRYLVCNPSLWITHITTTCHTWNSITGMVLTYLDHTTPCWRFSGSYIPNCELNTWLHALMLQKKWNKNLMWFRCLCHIYGPRCQHTVKNNKCILFYQSTQYNDVTNVLLIKTNINPVWLCYGVLPFLPNVFTWQQ